MRRQNDENQLAARILWEATNTTPEPARTPQERAEYASRARGTSKHMARLSPEEKSAQGKLGAARRWGAVTADNSAMPKKDLNQLAYSIVRQATGEEPKPPKDSAKAKAGRVGGSKGGPARANKLTPEQRVEIAKKAASARWKR